MDARLLIAAVSLLCCTAGCNFFEPIAEETARDGGNDTAFVDAGHDGGGDDAGRDMDGPSDLSLADASTDAGNDTGRDTGTVADMGADTDTAPDEDAGQDAGQDTATAASCGEYADASQVVYWSFDTPTPTGYLDESGSGGPSLRAVEGDPSPTVGVHNSAVEFDGDDDLVFDHSTHFELSQGTISFWFRDADPSSLDVHSPFGKDALGLGMGGHVQFYIEASVLHLRLQSTTESYELTYPDVPADEWIHLVATFGPNGLHLFIDGVQIGSDPYTGGLYNPAAGLQNEEPGIIGANSGMTDPLDHEPVSGFFTGAVDEFVTFDRQLDSNEVGELHDSCAP